ncbi:MAG: hypothetical protein FWH06_00380 [Oscillospiraceae bacterium]|nr:hypothetical protein [Oscillospiraceae bacterium]
MAGIFGFFDFTKPGKGVDPDEPQKRAPARCVTLFWRNLWRFVVLNMQYFVCLLPVLVAFHLMFDEFVGYSLMIEDSPLPTSPLNLIFFYSLQVFQWPPWLIVSIVALSLAVQGPLTCGLTYCLRNAVREEHYWRSDFWARAKSNLKQGLAIGVIDVLVFVMGFYNMSLFFSSFAELDGFTQAITVLSLITFPIYLAMRTTIYTQAVTFELTVPQILRNSFILALAGLPRHLLNGIICGAILILTLLVNGYLELLLLPFVSLVLIGYISMFISWPLVDKFLIKPAEDTESLTADDES